MRAWLLTFLLSWSSISAANIFHRPLNNGVTGIPLRVTASLDRPNEFLFARLFYKKASQGFYKQVIMRGSGQRFTGEIDGSDVVIQGTHYYIEVTLQDSSTITLPSGAPANFFAIKTSDVGSALNISIVSPRAGQRVDSKRPQINAAIRGLEFIGRREKVRLFIDGVRVKHEFKFGFIKYKPPVDLTLGRHQIKIQVLDEKGKVLKEEKSTFFIEAELDPEDKIKILEEQKKNSQQIKEEQDKWKKSGNFTATYQYAKTEPVTTAVANPDGYYSIEAQYLAQKDKTSFFLGPTYITNQATEGGSRIEKMSFGVSHGYMATKWGTVSTELTEYTEGGAAFLGGEISYDSLEDEKKTGFRLKSFSGETRQALPRALDPSQVGVYKQRAYGGQFAWAPVKNLGFFSVQGMNKTDDVSSIPEVSLNQARRDTSASAYAKVFLPKLTLTQLEVEYGFTDYAIQTPVLTDNQQFILNEERTNGQGFYARGQGNIKKLATRYNFDVTRNDPRFLYEGDLFRVKGDLKHTLFKGALTLAERANFETDNLENQKIQTTGSRGAGADVALSIGRYSLSVVDDISQQTITGANLTQQTDQVSNDFKTDGAVSFKFWRISLSPGASFNQQDIVDFSTPRTLDDQRNRTYQAKIGYEFDIARWVKFFGEGSYTYTTIENLTQGGTSIAQAPSGNVNLDFKFFKGQLLWRNEGVYELNSLITRNPNLIQLNSILTTRYETELTYSAIKWLDIGSDFKLERSENKNGPQDNLNINVGITRTEGGSLTFKLFNDKLNIPLKVSHSVTFDDFSPRQTDSETLSTNAGLTYRPDSIQTLKIDGSFIRFKDYVSGANSYDQYSATFSYSAVLQ